MEWREVSNSIIGATIKKDVFSDKGVLLAPKGTILTHKTVDYLLKSNIEKIFVSIAPIKKELFLQLDSLIPKSKQPFFWETYIQMIEDTKVFFHFLSKGIYENPQKLIIKLYELMNLLEDKQEYFEFAYSIVGHEDTLYRHSVNVAIISYLIGQSKACAENPFTLAQMGYFHDIGKTQLKHEILEKPSSLTNEERAYIETHTKLGVEILSKLGIHSKDIKQAALLHHESRNGNGYPHGYTKEQIPYSVQVISTADVFDSICSDRVYKKAKTVFESFNELFFDAVNGKLNPIIVFPFIEEVMENFINHKVKLNSGEMGTIYHHNPKGIIRPILHLDDGSYLDLSLHPNKLIVDFA